MPALLRSRMGHSVMSLPSSLMVPLVGFSEAGQAVDQLGLAVAVNTGEADDLAARTWKLTPRLTASFLLWLLCMVEVLHVQHRLAGVGRAFFSTCKLDIAAHHHAGTALPWWCP